MSAEEDIDDRLAQLQAEVEDLQLERRALALNVQALDATQKLLQHRLAVALRRATQAEKALKEAAAPS